jgi:hypothetical protein
METRTERPWLALYDDGAPSDIEPEHESALAMFEARCSAPATAPRSATSTPS